MPNLILRLGVAICITYIWNISCANAAFIDKHFCTNAELNQYCPGASSCYYSDNPYNATCECGIGDLEYSYAYKGCFCVNGKYGTLTCDACPAGGTSSLGNNTSITNCYIPAGTSGTDTTGKWEYAQNCYYSN